MGYDLWWRWNDGMSGHVWLSEGDLARLAGEMALQGWGDLAARIATAGADGLTVAPQEITRALGRATPVAATLSDASLWESWLLFLEGAESKGGLLVRR